MNNEDVSHGEILDVSEKWIACPLNILLLLIFENEDETMKCRSNLFWRSMG